MIIPKGVNTMRYVNVETFQNWAREFVEYKKNKGEDVLSIDFRASCIIHYHPSGLMSLKSDTFQGECIVTGIEKCE